MVSNTRSWKETCELRKMEKKWRSDYLYTTVKYWTKCPNGIKNRFGHQSNCWINIETNSNGVLTLELNLSFTLQINTIDAWILYGPLFRGQLITWRPRVDIVEFYFLYSLFVEQEMSSSQLWFDLENIFFPFFLLNKMFQVTLYPSHHIVFSDTKI